MTERFVTVNLQLAPEPRMPELTFISVPRAERQNGEIGLFVFILRTHDDNGIFWLYLGGAPTVEDAEKFAVMNTELFRFGGDWVIVECEKLESVSVAIAHLEHRNNIGTIIGRNVLFFANVHIDKGQKEPV